MTNDTQPQNPPADQGNGAGKQFTIQKIYLRDVSLETPNSPAVFTAQEWNPQVDLQLNSTTRPLSQDGVHEVVLSITVTSKLGDKTAYLVEVQQAGIFQLQAFSEEEKGPMLGAYCPNILFPYAREAISDLVVKAGFPQILLAPINFDAVYMQHQQRLQQQGAEQPTPQA